jgi:hypothetical protein
MKQDSILPNGTTGHSEKLTKLLNANADIPKMTPEEYKEHSINVNAEYVFECDNDADFFTLGYDICKKSTYTYFLDDLTLDDDLFLGEIKRSGHQDIWEEWDANELKVGTKIYQYPNWHEKMIAVQGNKRIVYNKPSNNPDTYDGELGQLLHLDTRHYTREQYQQHALNVEAKMLLFSKPQADFFTLDFYLCLEDSDKNDDLVIIGELLGEIQRNGIQQNWQEWDASVLETGTKIYRHPKFHRKFIAEKNGKRTLYQMLLEEELIRK